MEKLYDRKAACELLGGIGNTTFYALIREKKLEKRKIGRRTLVTAESVLNVAQGAADPKKEAR